MSLQAFKMGVNIVAYLKDNKMYGMTCAWATQVGYEEVIMVLGNQSVTGNNISKGDIIGISALNPDQGELGMKFGTTHSDVTDKFKGVDFVIDDSAIMMNNATRMMKAKVLDILHLENIEEDNIIYCHIISTIENGNDFYEFK